LGLAREPGILVLTNESSDCRALSVSARVSVDDEHVRGKADEVGPGKTLELAFPAAREQYYSEIRKISEQREAAEEAERREEERRRNELLVDGN
jgi:ribosomal 50S subunit-recycling heat shock protein